MDDEVTVLSSTQTEAQALLAELVGAWRGRARLWVEPGVLRCEADVRGEIVPLHGGRWLSHSYTTQIDGADESGTALIGFAADHGTWQVAWVDTWHTGTEILLSEGVLLASRRTIAVMTSYAAGDGPPWQWRTEFAAGEGALTIRHFNITADGDEAIAAEFAYVRA